MDRDARRSLLLVALLVTSLPAGTVQGAALSSSESGVSLGGPDLLGSLNVGGLAARLDKAIASVGSDANTTVNGPWRGHRTRLSQLDHDPEEDEINARIKPMVAEGIGSVGPPFVYFKSTKLSGPLTSDVGVLYSLPDVSDDVYHYKPVFGPYGVDYDGVKAAMPAGKYTISWKWWNGNTGETSFTVSGDGINVVEPTVPTTTVRGQLNSTYEFDYSNIDVTPVVSNKNDIFWAPDYMSTETLGRDTSDWLKYHDKYIPIGAALPHAPPVLLHQDGLYSVDIKENGEYTLTVPRGDYEFQVRVSQHSNNYGKWWTAMIDQPTQYGQSKNLSAKSTHSNIDMKLEPPALTGTVTDQSGNPIENTTVNISFSNNSKFWKEYYDIDDIFENKYGSRFPGVPYWNNKSSINTTTNESGYWEIPVMGTDTYFHYNITAYKDSNQNSTWAGVYELNKADQSHRSLYVRHSGDVYLSSNKEDIDHDHLYYSGLAGDYTPTDTFNLTLRRPLHGQVTDTGSAGDWQGYAERPIPDVTVEVYEQGNPDEIVANTTTNEEGNWSVDVDPGEYVVNATLHAVSKEKDVSVSEDEEDVGVEVTHKLDVIRGQVWKEDGDGAQPPPAPDTTVTVEPVESDDGGDGNSDNDSQASLGTEPLTATLGQLDASAASNGAHQSRLASPRDALAQESDAVESAANESVADANRRASARDVRRLSQLSDRYCQVVTWGGLVPLDLNGTVEYRKEWNDASSTVTTVPMNGGEFTIPSPSTEWRVAHIFNNNGTKLTRRGNDYGKFYRGSCTIRVQRRVFVKVTNGSHDNWNGEWKPPIWDAKIEVYEQGDTEPGNWGSTNIWGEWDFFTVDRYEGKTIPPGDYVIKASHNGISKEKTLSVGTDKAYYYVNITLTPLHGQVTDTGAQGDWRPFDTTQPKPIPNVTIEVYEQGDPSKEVVANTTTNENGNWSLDVDPGEYVVNATLHEVSEEEVVTITEDGGEGGVEVTHKLDVIRGVVWQQNSEDVRPQPEPDSTVTIEPAESGSSSEDENDSDSDSGGQASVSSAPAASALDQPSLGVDSLARALGQLDASGPQEVDLTGTVTDQDGQPLANATIVAEQRDASGEGTRVVRSFTNSGADGTWSLTVPDGEYDIHAFYNSSDQSGSTVTSRTFENDTATVDQTIDLSAGEGEAYLFGTAVDIFTGDPVSSALVTVTETDTGDAETVPARSDGNWTLGLTAPGEYDFSATAEEYSETVGNVTLAPGTVTFQFIPMVQNTTGDTRPPEEDELPPPEEEPDFGQFTGTVTDTDGEPIGGALVWGTSDAGAFVAETSADGTYKSREVPAGDYDLEAQKEGYENDEEIATLSAGETETVDFELEAKPAEVSGEVTDTQGEPIEDATITAEPTGETGEAWEATTDGDGAFGPKEVDPGEYTVTAEAEDYESVEKSITLEPEEKRDLSFVLELKPANVTGTVTDTDGEPIGGATVEGTPADGDGGTAEEWSTTTSGDGTYEATGVRPGSYEVTADADGYSKETKDLTLEATDEKTLDFTLEEQKCAEKTVPTNDSGVFWIGCPPGSYELTAEQTEGDQTASAKIEHEETTHEDLYFKTLTGEAVFEDGDYVPGSSLSVELINQETGETYTPDVTSAGTWRATVPTGTYTVRGTFDPDPSDDKKDVQEKTFEYTAENSHVTLVFGETDLDFTYKPTNPSAYEEVTFTLTKPEDVDNPSEVTWDFDLNDPAEVEPPVSGTTVTHSYIAPGTYDVQVSYNGQTATKTVTVGGELSVQSSYMGYGGIVMDRFDELETEVRVNLFSSSPLTDAQISLPGGEQLDTTIEQYGTADTPTVSATFDYSSSSLTPVDDYLTITATNEDGETVEKDIELDIRPAPLWALGLLQQRDNFGLERVTSSDGATVTIRDPFLFEESEWDSKNWPVVGYTGLSHKTEMAHVVTYDYAADDFDTKIDSAYILGVLNFEAGGEGTGTVNIVPEGSERLKFGGAEYDGSVDVGVSGTLAAGAVRILGWAITGTGALTFDWLLRWSEDAESFGDIENGTLAGGLDYQGGATGSLAGTASGIAGTAAVSGKVQVQVDIKPDQNPPFGPAYYYLLVEGALTGTTEGVSLNVGGKQTLIEWKGNLLYQDATPPVTGPFSLTQLSTLERQTAQAALTLGNFTSQIPPVTGTQPYENVSAVGTAGATGEATDALGGAATHARLTDRPHQDSAPAIAAVGDREVLAWQAGPTSETERGADIAVRIDEEGWGERTLVTDDDAYDAAPVLAADTSDGRLLAAWTRVEPYADPGTVASPEEQFPNYDVAIASAGADAPTDWSAPLVLSNNSDEQMDVSPSIVSVGENRWLVVWERNHNATFESTERSLRYALVEATDAGPTVLANGTLATEGVPVGPRLATAEDSDALVAYRSYAVTNGSLGQTPDVVALDLTVSGESVTATETVREETDGVVDLAAAGGHFVWATPTQQGRALVHHDGTETRTLNVTEEVISPGGLDLETHPESEDLVLSYNALTAARGESAMLYRVYHDGEWVTDRRLGAVDRAHRALEGATSVRASGLTRVTPIQPAEGDAAMADLFASTHEFAPEYALNVTVTNASGDVLAPGTTAAIGEDLTVEYTVRNVGDADASKRVPMALETVEGSVTNVSLPALAVGEEASGELDVAVPSDGTVSLVVDPAGETGPIYADPGGDTWQAREVTRRFASAALAPRGVRTTPHNDTHFNATVTIANDGQVSAEGVGVALTDGGQTLATTTIAEVAAGENASVRVPVARDAIDASPGTPERVVVDPAGELDASMVSQASQRVRLLETAFDVVEPRFYGAPNETLTAVVPVWNESPVGATATVRVSGLGAHPNASRPHPVATVGERNASVPGASSRGPGVAQVPVVLDDSVGVGANLSVVVESPHPNGGLADNKLRTRVGDLRSGVGNLTVDVTYEGVPVDNATVSVAGEMGRTDAEGSATFRRPTGSQSVSVSAPGDDGEMMRAKTTAVVVHKHETRVRADLAVTEGPVVEEPGDDQPGSDEERTRRRSRDDDDSPEERSGGPRVITDAEEIAALVELPAGVVAERAEQVTVESDPEGGQSVAEFTEASAVSRVSFEGSVSGEVTVTDIAGSSAPGAPGERVATVDVSVPAVQAERPARVQFRVSRGRLDALGVSAGELQVYHHREAESGAGGDSESEARGSRPGPVPEAASESEWESGSEGGPDALNTKVVAERTDAVIVEARTPGFSVFTVSAVSRPEPVIELRKERTASGMELVLDGSESRLGSGELVSYEWAVNEEWVSGERVSVSVEPGTYTVTLVVESDAGKREATTESITVLEGTPGVGTATAGWTATAGGGPSAGASGAGTATPGAMTDVRPEAESGAGSVETAVATAAGESDRERELGSGLAGWSVVVVMGVVVAVVVVVGLWRRGGI